MIKYSCLLLIRFYQRFLSPIKGFHCAHHRLHHGDTCSNAIKRIIRENRFTDVPRLSRVRFQQCKKASITLKELATHQRSDLPCDTACAADGCAPSFCSPDIGGTDISGSDWGEQNDSCFLPCEMCFDLNMTKRRTQRIVFGLFLAACLAMIYYYGSRIDRIELSPINSSQKSSLFERLSTRSSPSLRVVLQGKGGTIESEIVDLSNKQHSELKEGQAITIEFNRSIDITKIRSLAIQDARLSAAFDLIVVSQNLDEIPVAGRAGNGTKFRYAFKTRWSLLDWY